jgi:hypothetical protein
MSIKLFSLPLFLLITAYMHSSVTFAAHLKSEPDLRTLNSHNPIKTLDVFYRAVNRGELIVFDKKIEKSLLIPMQVEYIYKFDGTKPLVKIYSELRYPVPIPQQTGIKLRGISAILDDTGHIIEVRAHVVPVN